MFKFTKADVLNELDEYLQLNGDEPVRWLAREVRSWGEFSYDELAALIASGDTQLINWQSRYAQVVNERFNPLWLAAIQAASFKATQGRITIDDSDIRVKDFLSRRAAEFVQNLSEESKRAVASVILYGQSERLAPRDIAKLVRPLIGLNSRQAQANVNYRQKIFRQLTDAGLLPSTANQRADTAAARYAAQQHRFRAETIVHTELARAYNQGAYDGVRAAIDAKLMNHCEMVWSTAGTNRVCGRCLSLKDTVVGTTREVGVTLPPLHPRCRCVIVYREIWLKPDFERGSFAELQAYVGNLDDVTVRKWYIYHDKHIHEQIDSSLPLEVKARKAFELRNEYRTQARELMADQAKRRELDKKHPNKTLEETLSDKMRRKSLTYEQALQDIYETAMKSNPEVNRKLNLE